MHILVCETRSTGPGDPARVPSRSLAQLGGRGESQNCSYTAGCCKLVAPSKVIMGIGDPLPYRPLAKISGGTLENPGTRASFLTFYLMVAFSMIYFPIDSRRCLLLAQARPIVFYWFYKVFLSTVFSLVVVPSQKRSRTVHPRGEAGFPLVLQWLPC